MKSFNKRKASKITLKAHHKHRTTPKEEEKAMEKGGAPIRPGEVHLHKGQ